ncbi:hypothetical protein [Acetobacter indonesiensis]|nr:hypothetical protein [Acetobacter indonesiensis]
MKVSVRSEGVYGPRFLHRNGVCAHGCVGGLSHHTSRERRAISPV